MANYFRITAYHPARNVCAVFDSKRKNEKLWQFSSYLVFKGFEIFEVSTAFEEGDLIRVSESEYIVLRACGKGCPQRIENAIVVQGKQYCLKGTR